MFVNSIESLVRNGYQIHVIGGSGEIHVYFAYESQILQQKAWNRDAELIAAFLGGRRITAYYTFPMNQVPAPILPCSVAPEPTPEPASVPTSAPFMPTLHTLSECPKGVSAPKGKLVSDDHEMDFIIYTKEDGNLHLHWKVSREVAKGIWREEREFIEYWLNGRLLNTVSWEKNPYK